MEQNIEASPICRGKNLSWETIMLFYNYMPKKAMPRDEFHEFVEQNINSWTQTHSQIARQLAIQDSQKNRPWKIYLSTLLCGHTTTLFQTHIPLASKGKNRHVYIVI